ncbi:MAG: LysM peptidoglycan-binding domain-containing protein [Lentimicrobiaceae bacterium]|nr:LysM peptidoglycan-binding domain-containing protein [Lentimicrobiaceae bacterium]
MDILQFLRLFKRHLPLLIIIPILLAVVVFYFTRNQAKAYQSETVVYTGIGSGYSIETTARTNLDYFATNMQFDNLINLIYSRQTIEQTSLRLLAQHLLLEKPDARYISQDHFKELQRIVPKNVKNLVVKFDKTGAEREKIQQIKELEKQLNDLQGQIQSRQQNLNNMQGNATATTPTTSPLQSHSTTSQNINLSTQTTTTPDPNEYHVVEPGESLQSIASRYNISIGELRDINNLTSANVKTGQTLIIKKKSPNRFIYHVVQPGENLLTIAQKYDITVSELTSFNNLQNSSVVVGQTLVINRPNNKDTQNNLVSNDTSNFYQANNSLMDTTQLNSWESADLAEETPSSTTTYKLYVSEYSPYVTGKDPIIPPGISLSDYEKTVNNLTAYYASSDSNFVYELLNYTHQHYSIKAITSRIQVQRIQNSDLVKVIYITDDPGICQQTLRILSEVFMKNYRLLKAKQTDAVVNYFEEQVRMANQRLKNAEDRLLKFNQTNNIINYYEQSKYIAVQKEDLDKYYQDEQIRLSGASAALKEIEAKLTNKDSIYLKSSQISKKRDQLSEIMEKIAINKISDDYDPSVNARLKSLNDQSKKLKDDLKFYVDQLYLYSRSTQGIPLKDLLTEWLKNAITFEEAKASLKVLNNRKMDFMRTYQIFAPLGAMLKRIEREISVAEQSYLELLRSLNLAKMNQQNLEMSTNIKVVDPPYFPISANPSKSKYLVLLAAITGFITIAFIIIILEYLDSSIKTPERAEKLTGLKLAGVYPKILSNKLGQVDYTLLANRLTEFMIQNLKFKLHHNSVTVPRKPYLILFFSTKSETGKTLIASQIIDKLRVNGENVLYLNYTFDNTLKPAEDYNVNYTYLVDNKFADINSIGDLFDSKMLREENYDYDYIFLEIPPIVLHSFPLELMNSVDASFLLVKAIHHWRKADINALRTFRDVSREIPMVILNYTELYALEDIININASEEKVNTVKKILKTLILPFRIRFRLREV